MYGLCMGPSSIFDFTTSQRFVQFLLTGDIDEWSMFGGFSEDLFPEIFTKFH